MKSKALAAAVALAGVAALAVAFWARAQADPDAQIVRYDKESKYYRIRVVDYPGQGRRCLHFSRARGIQSSMRLDDPIALDLAYSRSMVAALARAEMPKDVLLVGLGGASLPKFILRHWPEVRLDVVEIDPDVVKVGAKFFELKKHPNLRLFIEDGRVFFKHNAKDGRKYDVIYLDAYASDHIPFHLTTREFLAEAKQSLKPGGVVCSNLWEPVVNRFYFAELATFREAFPHVYRFPSGTSGNVIVFGDTAADAVTRDEWIERARKLAEGRDLKFDLPKLVRDEYHGLPGDRDLAQTAEDPLTDDMAPANTLRREHPKHFDEPAEGS